MKLKYTTKIKLYNSYFDINHNLSAKAILNIFQDVASFHGEEIGVGFEDLLKKDLYWVISRIKIDIKKMPVPDQTVVVETWPHEKSRVDFDRDLKITDESGEILLTGTSKWCVIDTTRRMLARTDNVNYNGEIVNEKIYNERFGRIVLPTASPEFAFSYTVRFTDLDHNKHMNNTNYANLVLNATQHKEFKHFEINFINECKLDDNIMVYRVSDSENEYVFGKVDEKLVFAAYIN